MAFIFLFNLYKIMIYVRILLFECLIKKLVFNKKSYSQGKKKERKNGIRKETQEERGNILINVPSHYIN